jgi:prepilin-type N-terminal cleavage/methylation domain-containing protein
MNGGKNRQPLGYTIVEVMVVLAVSGVMFLIAAQFISGKQEKAAFTAGVNDTASRIQDVIEQVNDGKYSDVPIGCALSLSGTGLTINGLVGAQQGTQNQCVFLGKLLEFNAGSPNYTVASIAGSFLSGDTQPTLANDNPTLTSPYLDDSQVTPQSLDVTHILIKDDNGNPLALDSVFNFGFIQSLGSSNGSTFNTGAQTLLLVYSPSAGVFKYAQAVTVCVTDHIQTSRLVLGGNAVSQGSLNVDIQHVDPGVTCP